MRRGGSTKTYAKLLPEPDAPSSDEVLDYDYYHGRAKGAASIAVPLPPQPKCLQEAIFAAGSFWRLEAAFGAVDGVVQTATGYYGGSLAKPSYREVSEGCTGHTEAVRVVYDQRVVGYKSLCKIFWRIHDPTNKDYLMFNAGTHHRSAIFYSTDEQRKAAQQSKVERQMRLDRRIVTKLVPRSGCGVGFQLAENAHQKRYLQQLHPQLCGLLGLRSTDQVVDSQLACKLNGILGCGDDDQICYQNLKGFCDTHAALPDQTKLVLEETLREFKSKCSGATTGTRLEGCVTARKL